MTLLLLDRWNKVTCKDNKTFQNSPLELTSLKGQLIKGKRASRELNYWMIYVQGERVSELLFRISILCLSAAVEGVSKSVASLACALMHIVHAFTACLII